jgi:hypothetical protein
MAIRLAIKGPSGEQSIERDCYATFLVGRSPEAQICVAKDPHFSRRHCWIEVAPPKAKVVDLRSHNGTFVNGEQVTSAWLNHGDVISGGQTRINVLISSQTTDRTLTLEQPRPDVMAVTAHFQATVRAGGGQRLVLDDRRRVGRYEILGEIGRGAMGVVFLARRLATRKLAAVKLIIPDHAVSEKQVQLFLREASILSRLNHKRVVQLLEIGLDAGQMFLAMEFVQHRSFQELSDEMSRSRQIRFACGVMAQTLDALAYAHGAGVVHRDIKPANLLLGNDNGRLAVKVVDFGLAKTYADAGFSGLTEAGDVRGTLGFIAPEQLIDSQKAHPAWDLYSVGATLYYFLAGTYPHDVAEGDDPVRVILSRAPISIRDRSANVPEALAAVVDRALSPIPEQRFTSAAEMRECLQPFLLKS